MRFLTIAILGLVFAAGPAMGQTSSNDTSHHVFGSATCPQKIPCPDDGSYTSSSDLVANATACISQSLGLNSPDGFFDENLGLSDNGCLSDKSSASQNKEKSQGTGKSIVPQCCVAKLPDNTCSFHCELISVTR
jgi:hypothetical protein